jgi:hypothetical protein
MYVDQRSGRRLPGGTALGFGPVHQGIVAYQYGEQVILNTSLKSGRPVISRPEEFAGVPVRYVRPVPETVEESVRIEQNAWNLLSASAPWTVFNNCQDFVSMSYSGKPGSVTRNFVLGSVLCGLLLAAFSG